ncbi:hypothetical protein M0805_005024 [Coniferiporia weirii]|nr:hypothetical protein M0805_005024 [Coniferiporia weirii]
MRRGSYVPFRAFFYALLWLTALSELGDTGYRLHHTNTSAGFYDPIVVELLVTSVLTLIWIPCTFLTHSSAGTIGRGAGRSGRGARAGAGNGAGTGSPHGPRHAETAGNLILWTMWLVGAAIATNKWPNRTAVGRGREGSVLMSIVALSWIAFGFLTLAQAFVMMEYAAARVFNGGASSGAGSRSAAGTGAGAVAGGNAGTNTGVSPDTNTATNTGADTGVNPGANTGVNPSAGTDADTGANTGFNQGANTDANTDLETGTGTDVRDPGVLGAGIVHEKPAEPVGPGTPTAL